MYSALERTYLSYIHTSLTVSMSGVLIAQLFRLQHPTNPDLKIGYFVTGVPLGCACQAIAIALAIVGAHRYWRQQHALAREKVDAGGWEIYASGIAVFLVSRTLLLSNLIANEVASCHWQCLLFFLLSTLANDV